MKCGEALIASANLIAPVAFKVAEKAKVAEKVKKAKKDKDDDDDK